jgi:flagellar basal-body rod protein FlgB
MDPVSAVLINKALDGLSMRAMATAQNIANVNSPSFKPLRVSFEQQLRAAARGGAGPVGAMRPQLQQSAATAGATEMRLDLELATASETGLRYAALIDLLGRQLQISRTVIRGGQ